MEKRILKIVGQNVREKRRERGMSQEELGERAGFHFSYIGGVERAEKNITIVNLEKIANALNVKIHSLFDEQMKTVKQKTEDELIYKINQFLWRMETDELKKVLIFLSEIMKPKK
jgi:transcriptional regulator with XRE-family HTH domain